ncbi:MAG: 5-methyltetrahydropteroyltriglutamate--homocysteine methyltransferase [Thermoanaerobaculia bacterium]|nr:5-methyltetrahydropteroyltriglutamate--homocysteine methyltransferase [Thermoanaerobaculia bacterium]
MDTPPVADHTLPPDVSFDGGDLDCGNGLLLLIRQSIDPLPRGGLLEIRSTESSVDEDLPAWCRMTGNELVSWTRQGGQRSFLVCKGKLAERQSATPPVTPVATRHAIVTPIVPTLLPSPAPAPTIEPLSVLGIGSWPRPRWLLRALHDFLEGRLNEEEFQATADDAVRLAVDAQHRAGVDVITDGEQRRDSYANFVGGRFDNCQLIPLSDLLPLVDDPEKLRAEFEALDVPADQIRHPAVLGPLGRGRGLASHELDFVRPLTAKPIKIALPGPYLLSRILWMECLSDRFYDSRESLAEDVVRVLREELHFLLAAGAALVQFDEPVLTEVVYTATKSGPSFMCGALSERKNAQEELALAIDLINRVVAGVPRERTAIHICRGNWTPDESVALTGDYRPLVPLLQQLEVGTYFLELCTPRAGEIEILRALPEDRRIGVGVVNQKHPEIEPVAAILARAKEAVRVFGRERVLFNPDCGFATFADNALASAAVAEGKLAAIVRAVELLRGEG